MKPYSYFTSNERVSLVTLLAINLSPYIVKAFSKDYFTTCREIKRIRNALGVYDHKETDSKHNTIHPEHVISERPEVIEMYLRIGDREGETVHSTPGKSGFIAVDNVRFEYQTSEA